MLRNPLRRKGESQAGVFLVLLAVVFVVLIAVCAVMIGIGYLAVSKARLQNGSNFAALAAIEEFMRHDEEPRYDLRAGFVQSRAEDILGEQRLIGVGAEATRGALGFAGSPGPGGLIRFGQWVPELPPEGDGLCGTERSQYPCFIESPAPNEGPAPSINAVRLETNTQTPFSIPFASLFGGQGGVIATRATAAVVPRCTIFLMDASLSTTGDTHPFRAKTQVTTTTAMNPTVVPMNSPCTELRGQTIWFPPLRYVCPRDLALFAYNDWLSFQPNPANPPNYFDPVDLKNLLGGNPCFGTSGYDDFLYDLVPSVSPTGIEGRIWCSMQWERIGERLPDGSAPPAVPRLRPAFGNIPASNCYEQEHTPYGQMMIDKCLDPEPLTSFFLGFNAGLRLLASQRTAADRVRLSIFRGSANVNPYPVSTTRKFTTDPSILVQLTNIKNRGTYHQLPSDAPVAHPNFVDFGWFPIFPRGNADEAGTNVVAALETAINELSDSTQCPASAQKAIIIATDGVSSCARGQSPECSGSTTTEPTIYTRFLQAKDQLLQGPNSILNRLKAKKIALTVLLGGTDIRAHFIDRLKPGSTDHYLTYAEAVALGYRGLIVGEGSYSGDPLAHTNLLVDSRAICPMAVPECAAATSDEEREQVAFNLAGTTPGVSFLQPNGIFAHLAIETGGFFCPLLPRGDESLYVDDDGSSATPKTLQSSLRSDGAMLSVAPEYLTPGEYAAECVRKTIGQNPYLLVEQAG